MCLCFCLMQGKRNMKGSTASGTSYDSGIPAGQRLVIVAFNPTARRPAWNIVRKSTRLPYCIHIVCKWHYSAVVEKHFETFCNCIGTSLLTKTCWTMLHSCCALRNSGTTPFLWSHWEYHSARHGGRAACKTPFERFRRQIIALCHHLLFLFFFFYFFSGVPFISTALIDVLVFRVISESMFSICQQNVAWAIRNCRKQRIKPKMCPSWMLTSNNRMLGYMQHAITGQTVVAKSRNGVPKNESIVIQHCVTPFGVN